MQEMLNQQQCDIRELLAQELANIRGRVSVVNKPIVVELVNNGPIPSHATTVQEGNNDEYESYQGPE